eukprot:316042_1
MPHDIDLNNDQKLQNDHDIDINVHDASTIDPDRKQMQSDSQSDHDTIAENESKNHDKQSLNNLEAKSSNELMDDEKDLESIQNDKEIESEKILTLYDKNELQLSGDDDKEIETDLTDEACELGDNLEYNLHNEPASNLMSIESDTELPENITLLPSKTDTEAFADLYDPQMIIA